MSNLVMQSLISQSPDNTRALGAALSAAIVRTPFDQPLVIALNGELGAGKTTFVGGFMRALGVTGPVRSPTYTLIEPYDLAIIGLQVYHLDLYRLADASELEMLALRDLLEPGTVLLVEWAERGRSALPAADLTINLSYPQSGSSATATTVERRIEIIAASYVGKVLAASLEAKPDEDAVSL